MNRRQLLGGLLVAGAAGSIAGCGLVDPGPSVPAVAADPLEALVTEKQTMLDLYEATLAAHRDLAARITPLRDAHREHRDALLELLDARRRAALARATPPVPGPSTGTSAAPAVSGDPASALVALRQAERTASARSRSACLAVTGAGAGAGDAAGAAERVVVLGSICAAEASHEVALA
ncbi:hypothetical protein SAMN05443668_101550 [Cryptosporangium aurantiacum]|uniref:Ferritin-like domain-containing protein n=1 Tax=Cryptosporangium aurantiacum TaxID=134849 RepID=A0A1M7IP02_9ACTN|nr:hypothetical protein SAMN05443668_101550 [Cryptosporangium aurantiacum]